MQTLLLNEQSAGSIPIWLVSETSYAGVLGDLVPAHASWARASGYAAERHKALLLPDSGGGIAAVLWGLGSCVNLDELALWDAAALPDRLPAGNYRIATQLKPHVATQLALGWLLGTYRFIRFRGTVPKLAVANALMAPPGADVSYVHAAARAVGLARDLINTPANALGPEELAATALSLAQQHAGTAVVHTGAVLTREYPLIAAVGGGSTRPPRLVDCRWRRAGAPRVVLVGKGVCFDSGGLDLKPSSSMLLMKKDMGGAACVLALAQMLLELQAPIDLRILIPAVENSVSGDAYRPGDVLRSRKGLTVEVNNTDAEGRLVLADALTDADGDKPDLLIDMATLTGAARTALGPDLPAIFGTDDALLQQLVSVGSTYGDPVWQLPLWHGYDDELSSRVADLSNVASSSFAGAVYGALFLKRFVTSTPRWIHVDLYGWNAKERSGRPTGGEAQSVRAVYHLIRQLYG
jgi:leucyl aminopeptidase